MKTTLLLVHHLAIYRLPKPPLKDRNFSPADSAPATTLPSPKDPPMKAPVLPTLSTVSWTTSDQDYRPRSRFLPTNSTLLPPSFSRETQRRKAPALLHRTINLSIAYATRIFFTISGKSNHSNKVGSSGDKGPKRRYIYPLRREGYIGRYLYRLAWRQNSCKRERGDEETKRRRDEETKRQNNKESEQTS